MKTREEEIIEKSISMKSEREREHKQTERNGKEGRNKKNNKNNNRSRRKRIKKRENKYSYITNLISDGKIYNFIYPSVL